jgi:hypothetical protein
LLPEVSHRGHAAERVKTRLLALTNATFERSRATEAAIDECAQHGENRNPCDPSGGEAVELAAEPHAAQHGRGEHQHDENVWRTVLVLDVSITAGSQAQLIAAQRIGADGVNHSVIQTVIDLCPSQIYAVGAPSNTR